MVCLAGEGCAVASHPSPAGQPAAESPGGTPKLPTLNFQPVVNGVDFLDSAINGLLDSDDPRKLKYAVLHLQAAAEILVKVRLRREGIEHVFLDPYSANEHKLRHGKFTSVGLETALKRLEKVAGIALPNDEIQALKGLNQERNKLQHFGSTSSHEAVNTHACQALEVLLQFIDKHMVPDAPKDEAEQLVRAEDVIRRALTEINAVTQARLERLAPKLDTLVGMVLACPVCQHLAYAPEHEDRCLFCNQDWSKSNGSEIAAEYAENILCNSKHLAAQGRDGWPVSMCPECHDDALVLGVTPRSADDQTTNFCFSCFLTADDNDLSTCGDCGHLMVDEDEMTIRPDCFSYRMSKD